MNNGRQIKRAHQDDEAFALTTDAKDAFVREGCLIIRNAFDKDAAQALKHATFDRKAPKPTLRHEQDFDLQELGRLEELNLLDWKTVPRARLYLETGRSLPIADFAPKLWRAVTDLVGGSEHITRKTMGEQWILNAEFEKPPMPRMGRSYYRRSNWHIDEPGERTTLANRHDALALLLLWSDVDPGGGGPLYSGESLARVVQQLETAETNSPNRCLDTRNYKWARRAIADCNDIQEFTGHAGDVLITHALALHAAQANYSRRVRILENPTVRLSKPLNYSPDNPHPSPAERAIIDRLRGGPLAEDPSPSWRRWFR